MSNNAALLKPLHGWCCAEVSKLAHVLLHHEYVVNVHTEVMPNSMLHLS